MDNGEILADDPGAADVRELLERHLAFARAQSPPEDVHALDGGGLLDPSVTFFSYRASGQLLAVGALRHLDASHAELKSMHTAEAARGRGIGRAMLTHLVSVAWDRGYYRISLETGSVPAFAPARALYARAGFIPCVPFGRYRPSRYSTFMTLTLDLALQSVPRPARDAHPVRNLVGGLVVPRHGGLRGPGEVVVQHLPQWPLPASGLDRPVLDAGDADAEAERLTRLGARVLARHAGWITLADPEGNEFCIRRAGPAAPTPGKLTTG